ncbi:MAG TPA: methyltransferase domain-containing protein [Steroidobacteraceae bacterium]|nr:methyltransferase domain-containing protein [Steroidobacteraceae bacterium]
MPPAPSPPEPGAADDPYALDSAWLRRSFDRSGPTCDESGVLKGEVREALLSRLDLTRLAPRLILDLGAGTGDGARALKRRYPAARVLAVDAAFGPLERGAARRAWFRPVQAVCADATCLPLADASVDLILSNLMLPFCDEQRVLEEMRRVLAPGGYLTFSSVGPDTLIELRRAWATVDARPHVHRFLDMHDLGDALVRTGFADPVLDVETYTVRYRDLRSIARDLKAAGARNATRGRTRGLTTPRRLAAVERAYELTRRDGRIPATCEVVFGQAWAGARSGPRDPHEPGSTASISLSDLKRSLKQRRGA